jgi:DNA-binding PucR family transcriptional regulator
MNAILEEDAAQILEEFSNRLQRKMRDRTVCIGVSDPARDISSLAVLFRRAKAATAMARTTGRPLQFFAEMGLYRLLYMVDDSALLRSFAGEALRPLVDYDRAHDAEYVETLEMYLRYSGSIKAMSEAMFIHRNTILYRMTNIKKILGCSLETAEERLIYSVACMIRKMDLPEGTDGRGPH